MISYPLRLGTAGAPAYAYSSINLDDFLSTATAEELRIFSRLANKTGLHDRDIDRWHLVVIASHREHSSLDEATLAQWLIEHGWSEQSAWNLASLYEASRALLRAYDAAGGSARATEDD